jgi:hypothetical protein
MSAKLSPNPPAIPDSAAAAAMSSDTPPEMRASTVIEHFSAAE